MTTFTLKTPIETVDGRVITSFTVRKLKVKDMVDVQRQTFQSEFEKGLAVFAAATGEPVEVIGEMDIDDLGEMSAVMEGMAGKLSSAMTGSS